MTLLEAENPQPTELPTLGLWERLIDDGRKLTLVSCAFPNVPSFVCDAWTYEGNPLLLDFRKLSLGRIELIHLVSETPKVTLVTTVTPEPGAVEFLARLEGADDAPHLVPPPNLCYQLWRAPGFASKPDSYTDFVRRCFLFTEAGPIRLDSTVRLPVPRRGADEPCNNPPWVQSYLSVNETPPADPESCFAGSSPTRYVYPIIGTVSRDERYLAAIACAKPTALCQAWHDCLHNVPGWTPAEARPSEQVCRMKIYAMANAPHALLERVLADFPEIPHYAGY